VKFVKPKGQMLDQFIALEKQKVEILGSIIKEIVK